MEIVCTRKVPRVQISSSPPDIYNPLFLQRVFLLIAARSYWIHLLDTFQVRHMNDLEPLNIPGTASHSRYLSKYKTYLSHHRGIRYFRITVPNHLRSLLGKTEIRRSLDGMKRCCCYCLSSTATWRASGELFRRGRSWNYPSEGSLVVGTWEASDSA